VSLNHHLEKPKLSLSSSRQISRRLGIALLAGAGLLFPGSTGALNYTVAPSDTLYGLSLKFEVPLNRIIRANGLENEYILPGEVLEIPLEGIESLEVQPGDTLSGLAEEFGLSRDELRRYNRLESDMLRIGQKISIPPAVPEGEYQVLPGDTLLEIAINHNLSVEELRRINNLENDVIHPGDRLEITPPRPEGHLVKNGESIWSIARKYGIEMDELKSWNNLKEDVIHPGELLVLYRGIKPGLALASLSAQPPEHATDRNISPPDTSNPEIPREGEYFFSFPKQSRQPDVNYWETPDASVIVDYRRANEVLDMFRKEISREPVQDSTLRGWHIVIDPGHGGLDPGAIVSVPDGNGNPVVITEDEYAYDISLRLYRALSEHGASVSLTVIAPDHQIREGTDPRCTFVHRKNEVYNLASQNTPGGWRPVGSTEGLDLRKTIAARQINSTAAAKKRNGSLYISIHADNTPDLPEGTAVLFDGMSEDEKNRSREFAETLVPYLGGGSFVHGQQLRVLEDNPADASVLVEVRNIHYTRNAWALRSPELREQDARRIARGIVAWAEKH
jgi:LysM repeat protein